MSRTDAETQLSWPDGTIATPGSIPPLLIILSFLLVIALALLANRFTEASKIWLGRELLEYPLWAVGLGLVGNLMITTAGAREQLSAAFRTEFFLKTGLVLMGATINFADILRIGAKGMVQAVVVVTAVFFLTWYLAGRFGLEAKLRALMAASVSICGVSAAIAAAGAVLAKKEHLAYVATLVIVFALPLMLIQPYAAKSIGPVAGRGGGVDRRQHRHDGGRGGGRRDPQRGRHESGVGGEAVPERADRIRRLLPGAVLGGGH